MTTPAGTLTGVAGAATTREGLTRVCRISLEFAAAIRDATPRQVHRTDNLDTERLLQEIAELRDAVRARDEFISSAAHELRNPMTPLLMQVQSLRDDLRALQGQLPERVLRGAERLDTIVGQYVRRATTLLDISRLTSGAFCPESVPTDVSALLADVAMRMAPVAERAQCAIHLHLEPGVNGTLDPLAVEQIADNLLSNAVKYGAGKPVSIGLRRRGDLLEFTVSDQGIGISMEDQKRIFDRFERAVSRRESGGFGVGLWIVGRLVELLGGSLKVDSHAGQGSTFSVRLPLQPAPIQERA